MISLSEISYHFCVDPGCGFVQVDWRMFVAMNTDQAWEEAYRVAILETDDSVLQKRIDDAHRAIKARLDELALDHMGTPEEQQAIQAAQFGLSVLQKERVKV